MKVLRNQTPHGNRRRALLNLRVMQSKRGLTAITAMMMVPRYE
jgi:hypothetical protein